jgi:N utilization substance protein B
MPAPRRNDRAGRARSLARRLAMQALYQWQMTGQTFSELRHQFASEQEYADVDPDYFVALLEGVLADAPALDERLGELIDRPVAQLDPVEHAVLLLGVHELQHRLDVPYRVVINENVELAKKFGATEGHKFINAVLDRAARTLRATEQTAARQTRD